MKRIVVATAALTALAFAETPTATPLKTHTELSYVQTGGNTQSKSFAMTFNLDKKWERHILGLKSSALFSTENDAETKNKWNVDANYGYRYSERLSFEYLISYAQDRYSGYDSQLYTGPGVAYAALLGPVHTLDLTGSVGYARDDLALPPTSTEDDIQTYASGKAEANYAWQITEQLRFREDASYRLSFEDAQNYFVLSTTALDSKISDIFSMGLSYKVDYKNKVPAGKERTDTTFLASLIIDY